MIHMRYDIAIIGSGPAGVSAAITAKIRNKSIILLGNKNLSDKLMKAHMIENYPGLPHITGEDFGKALQAHLDNLGIEITEKKVSAIYTFDDYFSIQAGTDFIEATSVIYAGGVVQGKSLPGEEQFMGRGVSYCATCDGTLYRGKTVAVIGASDDAAEEALYLSEIVDKVLYFPLNGSHPEADNITVYDEKPKEIKGGMKADTLVTDKGEHSADCIFVLRDAIAPGSLIPGVATEGAHITVNLQMETNLPGLFAAGDITGLPYQFAKAVGQGNVATLSAVKYLATKPKA